MTSSILNEFLQSKISSLRSEFSFLLSNKRRALLDFRTKKSWFSYRIQSVMSRNEGVSLLELDRTHLLEDVQCKLEHTSDYFKNLEVVTFRGEPGFGSGPKNELFTEVPQLLLLNPLLFRKTENLNYHISLEIPKETRSVKEDFIFTGKFIGFALIHKFLTSFRFSKPLLKSILHLEVSLDDLDQIDFHLWKHLNAIKDMKEDQLDGKYISLLQK